LKIIGGALRITDRRIALELNAQFPARQRQRSRYRYSILHARNIRRRYISYFLILKGLHPRRRFLQARRRMKMISRHH